MSDASGQATRALTSSPQPSPCGASTTGRGGPPPGESLRKQVRKGPAELSPGAPGQPPISKNRFTVSGQPVGTSGSGAPPLDWLPDLLLRSQDGVGAQPPWGRFPSRPLQGIWAVPHCREAELLTPGLLPSLPLAGPGPEQSSAQVTDFIKTLGSWGPQCGEGKQRPPARSAVTAKAP